MPFHGLKMKEVKVSNNKKGGQKMKATMITKFGSEEAWKEFMRKNAVKSQESWAKNGRKPRGFAYDRKLASEAGAKGGRA